MAPTTAVRWRTSIAARSKMLAVWYMQHALLCPAPQVAACCCCSSSVWQQQLQWRHSLPPVSCNWPCMRCPAHCQQRGHHNRQLFATAVQPDTKAGRCGVALMDPRMLTSSWQLRQHQLSQSEAAGPPAGRCSCFLASLTDLMAARPTALCSNCLCRASALSAASMRASRSCSVVV